MQNVTDKRTDLTDITNTSLYRVIIIIIFYHMFFFHPVKHVKDVVPIKIHFCTILFKDSEVLHCIQSNIFTNLVLLHYAVTEYFIHSILLLVLMTSSNLICQWHLLDTCSVIPMDKLSVQCNLWSTLNNRPLQVHVPAVLVFLLPALSDCNQYSIICKMISRLAFYFYWYKLII